MASDLGLHYMSMSFFYLERRGGGGGWQGVGEGRERVEGWVARHKWVKRLILIVYYRCELSFSTMFWRTSRTACESARSDPLTELLDTIQSNDV